MVVIDSRAGRVIDDGQRLMVNESEWQWVTESVSGDWDHVVLATSLPLLLSSGLHALEAWNEAVCDGAWGKYAARAGERLRQAADLEHWAAFGKSFTEFGRLLAGLASGALGQPPASVTVISGDMHHSYLAAVDFPAGTHPRSAVYQAVCSPIHNLLPDQFRRGQRLATRGRANWAARRWPGWPGCGNRRSGGGSPTARGSRTCCPRSNSRSAGRASGSSARPRTRAGPPACSRSAKQSSARALSRILAAGRSSSARRVRDDAVVTETDGR